MEFSRDFKGVWIPRNVWLSKDISILEKVLYTEIDSLDNKDHCVASNDYFSTFFDVSEKTITRAIQHLNELGLIKVQYFGNKRVIETMDKMSMNKRQNVHESGTKCPDININNNKNNKDRYKLDPFKYVPKEDLVSTLVVQETPSGGSEGSEESIAKRHNTPNNPYVYLSDEERDIMRNELAQFGQYAYLATLKEFNNCNKSLIDDGLNPYAKGIDGFRRYIERCGVSTTNPDAPLKVRI